jgi:hypothetical protein
MTEHVERTLSPSEEDATSACDAAEPKGAVESALRLAWLEAGISEDTEFFQAARKARKVFNGAKMRAASADGGATVDLILWLLSERPLGRGERLTLAELLGGQMNLTGRPPTKAANRQAYRDLIVEAKAYRSEQRKSGLSWDNATEAAAKRAAQDPRARNKSPSTIERDLDRAPGRV